MQRDDLMRSLAVLADEIDAMRRREGASTFGILRMQDAVREAVEDHDVNLASQFRGAEAAHRIRRDEIRSMIRRLEVIGHALDEDGAAWTAERGLYERTIAAVTTAAVEARVPVPVPVPVPVAVPAPAPAPVVIEPLPIDPDHADDGADAEPELSRLTLFSVAARPVVKARCDALMAGDRASRFSEHVEHTFSSFIDIIGDKPLHRYLPADVQEYANVLARVPTNLTKIKRFEGMSYREAADANTNLKQPEPCMKSSTIEKYLGELRRIWRATTAAIPDVRDIGATPVTMSRSAGKTVDREGLEAAALTTWMAAAASRREPPFRWLPLLGLMAGLRLSEIIYLMPGDIIEYHGHLGFDLRRYPDSDRPLKTKTSERVMPVHPVLHDAGFIEWVRRQPSDRWLFPSLHEPDDPGDAASKAMVYWMKQIGIHKPQVAVFHSLRHNAKAWLRSTTTDRIADLAQGHAVASVGGKYGFRLLQDDEVAAIVMAPPPRGVDFSVYRKPIPARRMKRVLTPRESAGE